MLIIIGIKLLRLLQSGNNSAKLFSHFVWSVVNHPSEIMTIQDKPQSKLQKYRLTAKGKKLLEIMKKRINA